MSINFNPHYDNSQEPVKKETFAFQPEAKVYINSLQMSTNIFASKDHHRQKVGTYLIWSIFVLIDKLHTQLPYTNIIDTYCIAGIGINSLISRIHFKLQKF